MIGSGDRQKLGLAALMPRPAVTLGRCRGTSRWAQQPTEEREARHGCEHSADFANPHKPATGGIFVGIYEKALLHDFTHLTAYAGGKLVAAARLKQSMR